MMRMTVAQRHTLCATADIGDVAAIQTLLELADVRAWAIAAETPSQEADWFSRPVTDEYPPRVMFRAALEIAVRKDQWEVVEWFFSPEQIAFMGNTLAHLWGYAAFKAMDKTQLAVLEMLLEASVLLFPEEERSIRLSELIRRVDKLPRDTMQILLAHGAQVPTDRTLEDLAETNTIAYVNLVVEEGAVVVGARMNVSVNKLHLPVVRRLLELGVDWGTGSQKLEAAVRKGPEEFVEFLVKESFVDIDARDPRGRTPLMQVAMPCMVGNRAVFFRHERRTTVAEILLNAGADISALDHEGNSALHHAASGSFTGVMDVLLKHGASPHQRNNKGRTPLHNAVFVTTIERLLRNGSDPHATDCDGVSFVMQAVASEAGRTVMAEHPQYFVDHPPLLSGAPTLP